MAGWASTSGWAAQHRAAIAELMWLALRDHQVGGGSAWSGGVAAAAGWAMGVGPAPVTRRTETPLTLALVIAERWAAHVAGDEAVDRPEGRSSRPVAQAAVAELGVPWRDPLPVTFAHADGAWRALRWMTGVPGQETPFAVPLRHPDGTLMTAEDLYEQAVAAAPWRYRLPEERIELRNLVDRDARQSRVLADQVVDTIARVEGRSAALQR